MVAIGHVQTRVRISVIEYASVEQRLVAVLVLGAVLVFHGRMDMEQRCCKHSDQERSTEYCHASLSHYLGMLIGPDLGVNQISHISRRMAFGSPSENLLEPPGRNPESRRGGILKDFS